MQDLRAIAVELFTEQSAILVLANHPDRLSPDQISENVDRLKSIRNLKEMRALIGGLRTAVDRLRNGLGVRISREQLFNLMAWIRQNIEPGQACYMPAGMLSEDASFYSQMKLPPHARVSIDLLCTGREYPGGFEVRLLEASLFEDMCALFNECQECLGKIPQSRSRGSIDWKRAAKKHAALMRATVSAAFYFVEAYINCLATDYVYKNAERLSDRDRTLLTEWDSTKNRYRFVTTRDKLVQYPRIIIGATFPPIDENNCPDLEYFVTTAKDFRDAIVHASASFDPIEDFPKKERLFSGLKLTDVTKVVDTAVGLVERIETLINGRPQPWLHHRDESGLFPDKVFE